MEIELEEVNGSCSKLQEHVRELQQKNDDLERAKRSGVAIVQDLETRLNDALEGNIFLELELDGKETLKLAVKKLEEENAILWSKLKISDSKMCDNELTEDIKHLKIGEEDDNRNMSGIYQQSSSGLNTVHHNQPTPSMKPSRKSFLRKLNIVGIFTKRGVRNIRKSSTRTKSGRVERLSEHQVDDIGNESVCLQK